MHVYCVASVHQPSPACCDDDAVAHGTPDDARQVASLPLCSPVLAPLIGNLPAV